MTQEVQATNAHGHMAATKAGMRISGRSQRTGHLFSFVNRATTKDHHLHMGSNCNPVTEERPSDRQARELCRVREIHHPGTCHCHSCSPVPHPLHGEHPTVTQGSERSHQEEGIISKTSIKAAFTELNLFR